MTQHHAHEGADAHSHPHAPHPLDPNNVLPGGVPTEVPPMPESQVPFLMNPHNEAVAAGAQEWFAREFVGGLVAYAQAQQLPVADFLAEKCALLATRLATAESEVRVMRTQAQALVAENNTLRQQVEDCGCHDEDEKASAPLPKASAPFESRNDGVNNDANGHAS